MKLYYFKKVRNYFRSLYYKYKRGQLKNTAPTLITSDCFGGIAYHNLGLQFRSPTINLYFSKKDFIVFCNDIPSFFEAELVEEKDDTVSFPVGILVSGENKVRLNFMHYKTFEEAKEKWDERKQRVDFSNIHVIQIIDRATAEDIANFETIPYEKKMLITSENVTNSKYVVEHKILKSKNHSHGQILTYPNALSLRRYMDRIDYVKFLNS